MIRYKRVQHNLGEDTIHHLMEIARIKEFESREGSETLNRSKALRFAAREVCEQLGGKPYLPETPKKAAKKKVKP